MGKRLGFQGLQATLPGGRHVQTDRCTVPSDPKVNQTQGGWHVPQVQ